ncbi:MAG: YdcF family protein [Bryobacteraceae bacterium]
MAFPRNRLLLALLGILIAAALAVAVQRPLLRAAGGFLVRGEEPFRADIVVVLAGDGNGLRILKAAELVRQGYAPRILVSGPWCCYGQHESDVAIAFATRHGYPREWFIPLPHSATSTRAEAGAIVSELHRRGVRRFIVVTSDYHSRRAGAIFRSLAQPGSFRVVVSPDVDFHPGDWWRSREGQKQVFYEWSKTLANWMGL